MFRIFLFLFLSLNLNASSSNLVEHAKGFALFPRSYGYEIHLKKPGTRHVERFHLYRKNAPENVEGSLVKIPLQKVVSLSTTHIAHLSELGVLERVIGVSRLKDISNTQLRTQVKQGKTRELGLAENIDIEGLLVLEPQAVFTYGAEAISSSFAPLYRSGIPVFLVNEYAENEPLAYAEWLLYFSAFFDRVDQARGFFSRMVKRYVSLKKLAMESPREKPSVFFNIPYGGTWYMPAGESFMGRLAKDAGLNYLWKDRGGSGSLKLGFESVLARAAKAEVWLNPGSHDSLQSLKAQDPRFSIFQALNQGRVYNNNLQETQGKPNDFFERALSRPDLLLKDLLILFHPELFPGAKKRWYYKLK